MAFDPNAPFEVVGGGFDPSQPFEVVEPRTKLEAVKDTAIDLGKGVVGLGESIVGTADILTGNAVGKGLAAVGYDPKKTNEILSSGYSPARKVANENVANANGFMDTLGALVDNPSVAFGAIVESAPMSMAGAAAARFAAVRMLNANGIKAGTAAATKFFADPKVQSALVRVGAAAEGVQTAGSIQEQGRQEGRAWQDTVAPALAAGAGTAAIGVGSSKIPGFRDAEATVASAGLGAKRLGGNPLASGKEIAKSMFKEGWLEELPQSMQEQIFTNLAMDKPWDEGVGAAGAQGAVAGMGQGGGMTSVSEIANGLTRATPDQEPDTNKGPVAGQPPVTTPTVSEQPEVVAQTVTPPKPKGPLATIAEKAVDREQQAALEEAAYLNYQPELPGEAIDQGEIMQGERYPGENADYEKYLKNKARIDAKNEELRKQYEPAPVQVGGVEELLQGLESVIPRESRRAKAGKEDGPEIASPFPQGWFRDSAIRDFDAQHGTGHADNIKPLKIMSTLRSYLNGRQLNETQRPAWEYIRDYSGKQFGVEVPEFSAITVSDKAHEAATSPLNGTPQPTEAQAKAGNYKKGHISVHGLDVSIENPAGSERSGTDKSGKAWSIPMQDHYGYIKGTVGKDKDHLDVFINPARPESDTVFVVDQVDPKTGGFDEHKLLMGFDTEDEARAGYLRNYEPGWKGLGAITAMPVDQFKEWAKSGKTKQPLAERKGEGGTGPATIVSPGEGGGTPQPLNTANNTPDASDSSAPSGVIQSSQEAIKAHHNQPFVDSINNKIDGWAYRDGKRIDDPRWERGAAKRLWENELKQLFAGKGKDGDWIKARIAMSKAESFDDMRAALEKLVPSVSKPAENETQDGLSSKGEMQGFDSKSWNKERDDRIKESRAAGNKHLDQIPASVETMRGKKIYNVHDPEEKGVVRTVSNNGDVVVHWADEYSANKNSANEKTEQRGRKKVTVFESWLMPSDLKDYVFSKKEAPHAQADKVDTPVVEPRKNAVSSGDQAEGKGSAGGVSDAVAGGVTTPQGAIKAQQGQSDESARPETFVKSPDGSTDFGEITDEMAAKIRRQAGKIRLQHGRDDQHGRFGLAHIEARHGDQIRKAGFQGVEDFVASITRSPDQVWRGKSSQLLLSMKNSRGDVAYIVLQPGEDGDFYAVKTAFPPARSNYAVTKGDELLWDAGDTSPASGQRDRFASEPRHESGETTPSAHGQKSSVDNIPPAPAEVKPAAEMTAAELLRAAADKMEKKDDTVQRNTDRVDSVEEAASPEKGPEKAESVPGEDGESAQGVATEKPAEGRTQAEREDATAKTDLDFHNETMARIHDGEATLAEYKAGFQRVVGSKEELTEELSGMTKQQLLDRMGGMAAYRYKNEKKDRIARSIYDDMLTDFWVQPGMFSYGMDGIEPAIAKAVNEATESDLKAFAERVDAKRKERKAMAAQAVEAVKDPKTMEDFITYIRAKKAEGKTFTEARMSLAPEQRATFDELTAEKSRKERGSRKEEARTRVYAAGATTGAEIITTKHTRDGYDLFVVQAEERVEREVYNEWNAAAKKMGGWYSKFRGNGAVPGFQFKTREAAEAFQKYVSKGDTEGVKEQAQARRDAYADDRSQTAVERLTEMADKLEESADESLGRDRKANTSRRAGMAARAEANANSDKAMAKTMRNIAQAIQDGSAKFLDRVRQKAQVAELASIVGVANYAKLREQYPDSLEKHRHDPPTIETADHVEFPTYTAYRSNLAKLGRQLLEQDGTKLIGKRLMTVADDVTDAYLTFAKENLHKVSSFTTKDGALAVLPTKARAEEAIQRGGFRGQATTVSFKRGEHLIILSPSEAQSRGIWDGDDDKRITLSQDFGAEIVEKAGKNIDVPWHFETTRDRLKRLAGMGIETPAELRAAAREYIGLREAPKAADKVKELERAMIGRKNDGMDFFPTPEATADEMVQAAGIEPGMKVLEPSAGWGHIAERIRAAGVEPDVVEMSSDRQELLEAKGFNVVGRDFLDVGRSSTVSLQKELDALLERRESIREKQMARFHEGSATRARTTTGNADADRVNEQIISLRKQIKEEDGGATGYDRIIMNPPFSDRRDAEHVQHAYSLLNPGGRLVAIMGEGVFFGKDKKAQAFREWLESVGGTDEKLEQGTFLDPALPVNTGVNSRMVVIEKETDKGVALYSKGKATGTTTAQVETELRTFLKRGYDKLTGSGKLRVVQSVAELPSVGEDGIMPSMNRNSGTGDIPTESKPDMPDGGVVIKGKAPDGGVLSVVAANRGGNRIGSGEAFLSDDGELILDGERYRPGEKAYLFGGKFYRTPPHGLIDKTKNVIDSATGLLDSLKKTMWQIKWKEPKTVTIKKGENYTNLFGMEDIAEQDTDARNEKRYDGVDTNLYNQIDRVESLVDRPDVDALLKSLYQKELENYVFTVGGYLHIPSGNSEQLTKAQITAIERYVDNGGTLGASIIRALGDKEKIDAAIVAHPAAQESLAKEPKKRIKPFPNLNSPPSDGGDVTHLYSKDGSIAGVYDPNTGKIILVADNIKNGQAAQVMLHEGLHKIMREDQIFSKQHDAILSQFEAKRKYDYRVQDAFRRVPSDTPAHLVNEEALAYFIENKANHETSLFKKILANIRMWLMRMGIPMKNLTTDDLVAMVVQGVRRMANQERVADAGKTMEGELAPASYPMFSKAASLENLEEVAKTMGSITVKKRAKVDSTMLDRIFSTPEYYFNKASESAGRVLQAALLRRDVRFTKEQEILGKEFIGYVQSLRKSNPEAYAEANDYLVDQDQSGEGFSLKEEGETWKVIGQDGKMVSRHDTEQEAVAAMVEAEAAQLEKNGYSSDAIQAVKLARELTNRGFDVMAADMRKIIAEAKEAGLPNPMIGDGALDESGRYGIYGAHSKKPIALFATEQQANEAMDRAAQMISYVVQIRGGGERSFMSEVKANAWAKKHSGTVNGRKTFDGLTVRMRTDVEMRPMTVQQALAQMGDMRGTYFPRIRKPGEYVLIAKKDGHNPIRKSFDLPMSGGEDETVSGDKLSGWQKAFNLTTPMGREATRLARLGYNISMDRDTHPVDDMFSGTNLTTTIDAILQDSMAVIDKNNQSDIKAGQQINQLITMQVADIFKARGYLSSRLKRMSGDVVWEGYEADMGKALTQYGKGIAAGTAKRDTARSMVLAFSGRDYSWDDYKQEVDKPVWSDYQEIVEQRRIDPRRQKNLFVDVRAFMIDVLRNDEKTDRIIGTMKGLAVLKFLAFRVSSAAVNATNMVTGVPATLAGHAGISLGKAGAHIGKAVSAYTKYRTGKGEMSEADRAIFQEITDRGWDDAQFNQEAARELRGELGEAWNKIMTAGMFMFGAVEKANRATTLFAAYKAMAEKHPNLAAEQIWTKAKEVSDRAHGVYGKETRPAWTRGGDFNRLLALPYTFTKFSHNYMLNMIDLGYTRKEYKAAAYLLLSPAVLAGAGATVATPALMALASALGIGGDDPEEEYYKWAEDTFGGGTFARHGLAGLAGVNLKGSLQVNNPMPTKLSELAGAPGAIVTDTWKAIQHFGRGEMAKGAEALLPTGFGSMSKSLREGSEGITTGSYGQVFYGDEPLKADNLDMALRFFSFNPARISGIREKQWNEKEVLASYQERKKDIYAKIKRLQIQGKGITPEVNKEIVRYNELAKGSGRGDIKPITPKNIRLMLKLNSRASKFERDRAANE